MPPPPHANLLLSFGPSFCKCSPSEAELSYAKVKDNRDFWEQLAVAMALFVFLLQNRLFLKQTRFLLVAITELLLMYQSPDVCVSSVY